MKRQQLTDLQEATALDRAQRDYRRSGIVLIALEEQDMPIQLIAERAGETPDVVQRILRAAGIPREHDYFADSYNSRRRMVG